MNIGTIDVDKLRGVGDKFVGLYKELAGVVVNSESLQKAGQAQQKKATETLQALTEQAKAQAQDTKAKALHASDPDSSGSGVVAEVKGKAKQAAGRLVGDPELQQEGKIDEERGAAGRAATQHRASAKVHEAEARAADKAQQAAEH